MFDIKWIRDNPDAFDTAIKRRGLDPLSAELIAMDETRRTIMTQAQSLQAERNKLSKEIGIAKA